MPSPPAYTPLAAHDAPSACTAPLSTKLANEAARCDTDRCTTTTKEDDERAFYTADQPSRGAAARAAIATSVVALVALGVVGFALCGGTEGVAALGRAVGCSGGRAARAQELHGGEERHQWARRQEAATGKEEFSTTTYLGDVTTYVKTTRPIVNPGGYTFGTLTGYVPVPTTTASSTAAAVNSTSSSSSSLEPAAPSSASFSRSVTSLPAAPTSSSPPSSAPASASSAPDTREPWASRDADADAAESSPAATPSAARRLVKRAAAPEPAWDFAGVDAHLLHRRGEDFEAAEGEAASTQVEEQAQEQEEATVTGKEEFSTSTNRQGGVVTLVKTTRPIVNPGGYVIGTLDGAWVDVARQTDRTTLPPSPTSTLAAVTSSSSRTSVLDAAPASSVDAPTTTAAPAPPAPPAHKRAHDELRRRNVVQLA
ncbi:hypothetical protein JCM3775_000310 [Rhodotorula graminis]